MTWQPIETAPKDNWDGFLIDAPDTAAGCTMATFDDGILVSLWDGKPFADHVTKPKYWMPLPSPPQEKDKGYMQYRCFEIHFEYPPIPIREMDYLAYDPNDPEGGYVANGATVDECKAGIDRHIEDKG